MTLATEYHLSNGKQYYSKFAIVIQAMMLKQMLVHKLFVVRSDASRFTATIFYSLFGDNVVIIETQLSPYQLQHHFRVYECLLYSCYFPMWYPGSGVILDCIVS